MAKIKQDSDELWDALDYEEGAGDLSKAERVITLCKRLLAFRPDSASHGGSSVSFSPPELRKHLEDARRFKASHSGSGAGSQGVTFLGVNPPR